MAFLIHLRQLISMIPFLLLTGSRPSNGSNGLNKSNSLKKLIRTNRFRDALRGVSEMSHNLQGPL